MYMYTYGTEAGHYQHSINIKAMYYVTCIYNYIQDTKTFLMKNVTMI